MRVTTSRADFNLKDTKCRLLIHCLLWSDGNEQDQSRKKRSDFQPLFGDIACSNFVLAFSAISATFPIDVINLIYNFYFKLFLSWPIWSNTTQSTKVILHLLVKAILCHLCYEPALCHHLCHTSQSLTSCTPQDRVIAAQSSLQHQNITWNCNSPKKNPHSGAHLAGTIFFLLFLFFKFYWYNWTFFSNQGEWWYETVLPIQEPQLPFSLLYYQNQSLFLPMPEMKQCKINCFLSWEQMWQCESL